MLAELLINYRYLDEKDKKLQEALKHSQILERDIAEKEAEVIFFFAHSVKLSNIGQTKFSKLTLNAIVFNVFFCIRSLYFCYYLTDCSTQGTYL